MTRIIRKMSTPAYREAKNRLSDMDWNTSVQNLMNWADKGAMQLNKLIPALKKNCPSGRRQFSPLLYVS